MTCPCGSPIEPPRRLCDPCRAAKRKAMYERSNELRRQRIAAMPKRTVTCMDCDRPVSRKGQRCATHSKAHKADYLRRYRRGEVGTEITARPAKPAELIVVTSAMRRALPLARELNYIAAQAPHLNWREL